jgi:hypothetical protein
MSNFFDGRYLLEIQESDGSWGKMFVTPTGISRFRSNLPGFEAALIRECETGIRVPLGAPYRITRVYDDGRMEPVMPPSPSPATEPSENS